MYVCLCASVYHRAHMEIGGQPVGTSSLTPPCGSWDLSSDRQALKTHSPLSYPTGPQSLFSSRHIWLPCKESSQTSPSGYFIRDIWCGKSGLESGADFRVWVAALSHGLLSHHSFYSWFNTVAVLFPWDSVMKWMSYRTFSGKTKCCLFSLCSQNKGLKCSGRSQRFIQVFLSLHRV